MNRITINLMQLKYIQYILIIIVTIEVLETYSFESASDCGKSSLIGKSMTQFIVGGTDAKLKEFPFMASLQRNINSVWKHFCGGTVLNNRWVLTAAHCLGAVDNSTQIQLLIGLIDKRRLDSKYRYKLNHWIVNGCYDKSNHLKDYLNEDIALMKTSTDIRIDGSNVGAICLPPKNKGPISDDVIVSGWGVWTETNFLGLEEKPNILQKLYTKIVSEEFCQIYVYSLNIGFYAEPLRNRLCIYKHKSNICRGDSGGPLMQIINGKVYQFGIASFGSRIRIPIIKNKKCLKSKPSFYWNVSKSLDWISNAIEKYGDSSKDLTIDCKV